MPTASIEIPTTPPMRNMKMKKEAAGVMLTILRFFLFEKKFETNTFFFV